ncbi:hypothetical protein Tco_1235840 [Tanacetum coccineum]
MSFITAQQTKLDLEPIPKEKRLEIGKCNENSILERSKENPHFKSFWMLLLSLHATLPFSSLQMFHKVQGQDLDVLPTDEEIVSFLRELGHTGEINSLNDVVVDQMHQPWRTFATLINISLSRKTTGLDKLRLSKAQIL